MLEDYRCMIMRFSTGLLRNGLYGKKTCKRTQCPQNFYLCYQEHYCISIELICDGIKHCYMGDDEINCSFVFSKKEKIIFCLNLYFRSEYFF